MVDAKMLHELFLSLPLFDFSNYRELSFDSGIYIMFEKGETFNGRARIVRVGTHNKDGNLIKRLANHKGHSVKSKNASIFLHNVGLALLNRAGDSYLEIYKVRSDDKEKLSPCYDRDKELAVTREASAYIQENISFVCLEITAKEERLRLEGAIISTLAHDSAFKDAISDSWLGLHSPKEKITGSGLWVTDKLNHEIMTPDEYIRISELCKLCV